jgi:hypothetical protein
MGFDWTEFNYHGDSRVLNARDQREFNEGFNAEAMTFTFIQEDKDGEEVSYTLPAKFEVCPTCNGRGTHVRPSVDASGFDGWDDVDEYGESNYLAGAYNVTCQTCHGRNVVPSIDRDAADDTTLALWDSEREEEASYERLCRMERMMGA